MAKSIPFTLILILLLIFSFRSNIYAQNKPDQNSSVVLSDSLDRWVNIWWDAKDELVAVQWKGLNEEDRLLQLSTSENNTIQESTLYTGSTIAYFDTQTLYAGDYWLHMQIGCHRFSKKIVINK